MSIEARFNLHCEATEIVDLGRELVADPPVIHDITGAVGILTASSAIPATKVWSDERTLVEGSDVIDLRALPRGNLSNLSMSGLKVRLLKIKAAATNTDVVRIGGGGMGNSYLIWGGSLSFPAIPPGGSVLVYFADTVGTIDEAHYKITSVSSDADAKYQIIIVAG